MRQAGAGDPRNSERNFGAEKQSRAVEGCLSDGVCGRECSRQQHWMRIPVYFSSVLSVGCRASCLHPSLLDEDFSLESKRGTWKKGCPQQPLTLTNSTTFKMICHCIGCSNSVWGSGRPLSSMTEALVPALGASKQKKVQLTVRYGPLWARYGGTRL